MATTTTIEERRKDYFQYNFYEPLELFFYQTLRSKYPEMTVADIVVCRDVFIRLKSIDHDSEFGDVVDRMQIWTLRTIPEAEWAVFFVENKERVLKSLLGNNITRQFAEDHIQTLIRHEGLDEVGGYQLFPDKSSITEAIGLARGHGYIRYELYETDHNADYWNPEQTRNAQGEINDSVLLPNAHVRLRPDVYDTLKQSIDGAAKSAVYVMNEALEKYEREQAELDRRHTS